jgi:acetyltransferase-like isoleucine patch superfamily enzyme
MVRNQIKRLWETSTKNPGMHQIWAWLYNLLGKNHIHLIGSDNCLKRADSLLLNMQIDVIGKNNLIEFGEGCRLSNTLIRIRGDNHRIVLGKQCTYQGGNMWIEDHDCILTIGDNTTVVEAVIGVTEPGSKIEIGPECMFAHGIELRCGDSHSIIDKATGKRINYAKDIKLGKHIWLASDVMILKGVELGDDCVVASRALVTKSFPANSLIGGAPAAVIRENIAWDRRRIYDQKEPK